MHKIYGTFFAITFFTLLFSAGMAPHAYGKPKVFDQAVALKSWQLLHDMEVKHDIPQGLLHAISLMETGGGISGQIVPWPYAVNVNTTSWKSGRPGNMALKVDYLANLGFKTFTVRKASTARVQNLTAEKAKAVLKKIDADMPVELRGDRFSRRFTNKWQAVFFVNRLLVSGHDNVDIGLMQVNWMYHGQHFTDLAQAFNPRHNVEYAVSYLLRHRKKHDWWGSVGRYHSGTQKFADRYIKGVWNMYQKVHRLAPQRG